MNSRLFSPLRIGTLELSNRIVAPPMLQFRPITSPDGIAWYRRLAAGGAGLVIVEATGVLQFGDDLTAETLTPLVDAIHEGGAAAAIQLFPTPFGVDGPDQNELSVEQIEQIIAQYGVAAKICRDAGFDGVEPHGAHGYLINRFFMPDKNKRKDEYGGSLANRCRLGVRIVEQIRRSAGDALLILYRHTPIGEEYSLADSLQFAERLIEAGADVLDISPGRSKATADLAAPFADQFDVPVITVGGMEDTEEAEAALADGRCSLVAVGRQLIADAQWPRKVAEGRDDEIVKCIKCNKNCYGHIKTRERITCILWPGEKPAEGV